MSSRHLCASALLLVAAGCASSTPAPAAADGSTSQTVAPIGRNRDVITQEELSTPENKSQNVLDLVRKLRPQFLTNRSMQSTSNEETGKVHASIDSNRILSVDELRSVVVSTVLEIRYLNVAQAQQRFGSAAMQGPVIVVRTTM